MTAMAHDTAPGAPAAPAPARLGAGLVLAVVSAVSFGLSGALARGLLDIGWTPGSVTLVRVALGALVLVPAGVVALRGRWALLRRHARLVVLYGTLAVAGAQFCYFAAIEHMQVGPAILIEYTAPAAVVVWLWLRHGQRPGRLTLVGAVLAAAGLVLVLDVVSGAELSPVGVLWALGAMVGCAAHFVISADDDDALPPLTLAAGGLLVGTGVLGALAVVGVLPLAASTAPPSYAGHDVDWWQPVVALGLVTAAVAYASGVAATRRLGSRLGSFVALLEVLASVGWAWLLLAELPGAVQLAGGSLILVGVVAVKLGERSVGVSSAPPPRGSVDVLSPCH
jgi:drug/metabolite transporter (DMT)-like permease